MPISSRSQNKTNPFSKAVALLTAVSLVFGSVIHPVMAQGSTFLPPPGAMLKVSPVFLPTTLVGVRIYPENPFRFDFITDTGDAGLEGEELKGETLKLMKYFLTALTVPEKDLWVNLSPYEADRLIPDEFGRTEMGRDLLAQDYVLKQITATLMYPEEDLGREFWQRVYKKAAEIYGTTDIPVNTFNKVWIVPQRAAVYTDGGMAFITDSRLKVMLEKDYVSLEKDRGSQVLGLESVSREEADQTSEISSAVVREVILPEIEKEVNEGKNFAGLRQVYHALILATWFKRNLKASIWGKIYLDQNKTGGALIEDSVDKERIYNQYLEAFRKGVYNYIREDYDEGTQETVARKYFSGGAEFIELDKAMKVEEGPPDSGKRKFLELFSGVLNRLKLVSGRADAVSNESGVTRRQVLFGLTAGAAVIAAAIYFDWIPDFLKAGGKRGADALTFDPKEFNLNKVEALSVRQAKAQFAGLSELIGEAKVDKQMAGEFLWKVLGESLSVAKRAEAATLLIRHKYLTFAEIKKAINDIPDADVVKAIYDAIAEDPSEREVLFLRESLNTEPRDYFNREAFFKALQNAKTVPREILEEIEFGSRDVDIFDPVATDMEVIRNIFPAALGALAGRPDSQWAYQRMIGFEGEVPDFFKSWYKYAYTYASGLGEKNPLFEYTSEANRASVDSMNNTLIRALARLNTPAAQKRLLEWAMGILSKTTHHPDMYALGDALTFPGAEEFWFELGKRSGLESAQKVYMAQALGKIGTKKAADMLIEWGRQLLERASEGGLGEDDVVAAVIQGLGSLGTDEARRILMDFYQKTSSSPQASLRELGRDAVLPALFEYPSPETLEWMWGQLISSKDINTQFAIGEQIYKALGYRAIEETRQRILKDSKAEVEGLTIAILQIISSIDRDTLSPLNEDVDADIDRGEGRIKIFAERLKNRPEVLYILLGRSHEVTSHSFSVLFEHFNRKLSEKYGNFDFARYGRDEFNGNYLTSVFFTFAIFDKLSDALKMARYEPEEVVKILFSSSSIGFFVSKPALFVKVLANILQLKGEMGKYRKPLIDKLAKQTHETFRILLKLLVEDKNLSLVLDPVLKEVVAKTVLPTVDPVLDGPSQDWIGRDGVTDIGMYWSTEADSEKAHYDNFSKIFSGGYKEGLYANFSGYRDRSSDAKYAKKLAERGAEKILVKEFAGTGRSIEIYLYTDLGRLKESPHKIVLSRGHSGTKGIDTVTERNGILRFLSYCRSVNESDEMIKGNPQDAYVTITGTGRADETNPTLYYLLEYLGTERKYGSWREVKDFIRPHLKLGIEKYNFPSDDVAFKFATILKIREKQRGDDKKADNSMLTSLAQTDNLGGIDLNPAGLDLKTNGQALEFNAPLDLKGLENVQVDGFVPVIFQIVPLATSPMFIGESSPMGHPELSMKTN